MPFTLIINVQTTKQQSTIHKSITILSNPIFFSIQLYGLKLIILSLYLDAEHQKAHLAKLEYDYVRPGVVDLWHTEVPPEFQGHGIAKHLAKVNS